MRFADRTVIVTGAGSGIGQATALRVAEEGGRVVAVDIAKDRLVDLTGDHPTLDIVPVAADVADNRDLASIMDAADGPVAALANVAGIMDSFEPVHEVDDARWQRLFSVNVDGPMKLMRAVLPGMLDAKSGAIVNVASAAGLRGGAAGAAYTATKHALVGLTRNSAVMYAAHGVRVNAVCPGGVATNIEVGATSEFGMEVIGPLLGALMPSVASPAEVAAAITWLLSDDSANVSGAIVPSDGRWTAT